MRDNSSIKYELLSIVCFLLLFVPMASSHAQTIIGVGKAFSRAKFARSMAHVRGGMTQSEVLNLVGSPDAVRTEGEVLRWCYGLTAASDFPTLGEVDFDASGHVNFVFGDTGTPPASSDIPEARLRRLIGVIARVNGDRHENLDPNTQHFYPLVYIAAANTLIPEGKTAVLAAVTEYLRVIERNRWPWTTGLDLLLRILFDPPVNGIFPSRLYVRGALPQPANFNSMLRFPMVLIDDIPIEGADAMYLYQEHLYTYQSMNERHAEFLRFGKTSCTMRTRLLEPPSSPLKVLDKLADSPQWYWSVACEKEVASDLYTREQDSAVYDARRQLLRMVVHVYPAAGKFLGNSASAGYQLLTDANWEVCVHDVEALKLHWNTSSSEYEAKP